MSALRPQEAVLRRLARARPFPHQPRRLFPSARYKSSNAKVSPSSHEKWTRPSAAILATAAMVAMIYKASQIQEAHAEAAPEPTEVVIEKTKKKKGASKEQNRGLISSQHLQVKKSWENPGVYIWGSNTGKVAAPESSDVYVKTPRRLSYFDDILLRDLKLDRNFGAAVLENGDLVQWGKGYSEDVLEPTVTLKGKDLQSIAISRDRVIGLAKNGTVYSIPASRTDQVEGVKLTESSWIPFWSSRSNISYRKLQPPDLSYNERVTSISGGLEHVILLTSTGRVFTAASGTEDFPSRGQLGVPGVTWLSRPAGPYDMCHEVSTLRGFDVTDIAAGDHHSLCLDREGRVFAFGDNSSGQLGFEYSSESPYIDAPSLLPISKLYQGTGLTPKVTTISAGGTNSFFTIDAVRVASPFSEKSNAPLQPATLGRVTADTWASGSGIKGSLGNGRWTHMQGTPTKIPALSGLFEYDETARVVVPIRMAQITVGSTHTAAVMDNVTYLDASEKSSENDTNWGADVLWWGGNEYYQLGTGKRNNVAQPIYIRPLDLASEEKEGGRSKGEEHRFHVTPRHTARLGEGGKGRKVSMEQRVECGRNVTAVYSGV